MLCCCRIQKPSLGFRLKFSLERGLPGLQVSYSMESNNLKRFPHVGNMFKKIMSLCACVDIEGSWEELVIMFSSHTFIFLILITLGVEHFPRKNHNISPRLVSLPCNREGEHFPMNIH